MLVRGCLQIRLTCRRPVPGSTSSIASKAAVGEAGRGGGDPVEGHQGTRRSERRLAARLDHR